MNLVTVAHRLDGGWCVTKCKHLNAGAIFLGKKSRPFETWNWSNSKVTLMMKGEATSCSVSS